MSAGVVKWFNTEKGFGFIIPDEGGPEVFVHQSAVHMGGLRSLDERSRVRFDLAQGPKGPVAVNVQKA
jgi:CspA family cold shock protein